MLFHLAFHLPLYQMGQIRSLKTPEMYLVGHLETELILYLGQEDLLQDQTMEATGFLTMEVTDHLLHSIGHNQLDLEDLPYLIHHLLTLEGLQDLDLNQMVHQDHQVSGNPQVTQEMELTLIHLEVEEAVSLTMDPIGHLLPLTDLQILVLVIAQAQTLMDLAR